MVVSLKRGADLHMFQLMPLPLTVSCFSKIQMVLHFWYQLTWVVPDKGPLMCVLIKNLNRGITESVTVGRINILTTSIHHARHSQCTQLSQIWIDYSAHYSDPKQKFHLANIAFWVIGLWKMSHSYVSVNQHGFSYHQLRAASLISWNAAIWRSYYRMMNVPR